jgi:hypothetical protein
MKDSENAEENRDRIVQAVLDLYSVNDEGNLQFEFRYWGDITRYQNILTYSLMKIENFEQKFDDARYSFPFPKNPMFDFTIKPILHRLKKENAAAGFEECKKEFEKKLSDAYKEPMQDYDLYFLLDIEPTVKFFPFCISVNDRPFDFFMTNPSTEPFSSPYFSVKLSFINHRFGIEYPNYNTLCLHFQIPARNHFYAMKEGIRQARFILCWIGLLNNFNSGTRYSFRFQNSFENCPSPILLMVGNQDKDCVDALIWEFDAIHKNCPIQTEYIKENLSAFSKGTADVQKILSSALDAYYTGLHENNIGFALLAFWASIEWLCLKGEKMSHKKMLNRLFHIIPPLSKNELKIELDMLLELRNKAIHQWDYNGISEDERHLVKGYADMLLNYYMTHFMTFNQDEIECFFSKCECNSKELEGLGKINFKVYNLIQERRKKIIDK